MKNTDNKEMRWQSWLEKEQNELFLRKQQQSKQQLAPLMKEEFLSCLDEHSYSYDIKETTLIVKDTRWDIFSRCIVPALNRYDKISSIRFTDGNSLPEKIENLKFIAEIIFPDVIFSIPKIIDCPHLVKIHFLHIQVNCIGENDFAGWPYIPYLKLRNEIRLIGTFTLKDAKISVLNLSECSQIKYLPDHAFQGCSLEKIILPPTINRLPYYCFLGCENLKEIIAPGVTSICFDSLSNCPRLNILKFSPDFKIDQLKLETHSDKHTGVILSHDEVFSYIWSFTDFKFYYAKRIIRSEMDGTVKSFVKDGTAISFVNARECNAEQKNGYILLNYDFTDYEASDIKFDNELEIICNSKFQECIYDNKGYIMYNSQRTAIQSYCNSINKTKHISFLEKLAEIDKFVRSLDITKIIKSYHTEIEEHHIPKVGGDDRFESEIHTSASYTDEYIESLLPSHHSSFSDSGYTSDWYSYFISPEERQEIEHRDEEMRQKAFASYNIKEHIECLFKHYCEKISYDAKSICSFLHVEEAKEIANRNLSSYGYEKVIQMNKLVSF